jgi:hypothetical protein
VHLDDFELGLAVPAVETGTLDRSASILIQAGLNSRLAAIKAVRDTGAVFTTGFELQQWLASPAAVAWSSLPDWPTAQSRDMWLNFVRSFAPSDAAIWAERRWRAKVVWLEGVPRPPDTPVRLFYFEGHPTVVSADGIAIGVLQAPLNPSHKGLVRASVMADGSSLSLSYLGPDDLWLV